MNFKEMLELYTDDFKTVEIMKEDLNKWKDIPYLWNKSY